MAMVLNLVALSFLPLLRRLFTSSASNNDTTLVPNVVHKSLWWFVWRGGGCGGLYGGEGVVVVCMGGRGLWFSS